MASALLESSALSAFFGSIEVMVSAGMQPDEAVLMLAENREDSQFKRVCDEMYVPLVEGDRLSEAMSMTGAFPAYSISMVEAGEASGRLDRVLHSLSTYYDEENRLFEKLRTSIGYPAALLCMMAVILVFTVAFILPVFADVYQSIPGSMSSGSFAAVNFSLIVGRIALGLTLACAVVAVVIAVMARNESGRQRIVSMLESLPSTRQAMYQLAVSRFSIALSTYVSSGTTDEHAMAEAMKSVTHQRLLTRVNDAYEAMTDPVNPRSLSQAISESDVFDPFYARMLTVGSHFGSTDSTLRDLSQIYLEDSFMQIDRAIDGIEPVFAGLLTVTVGVTLVAIMLPLISVMVSIG